MCPEKAQIILGDRSASWTEVLRGRLPQEGHAVVCDISPVADERALQEVLKAVEGGADVAVFGRRFIDEGPMGRDIVKACNGISTVCLSALEYPIADWADVTMERGGSIKDILRVVRDLPGRKK